MANQMIEAPKQHACNFCGHSQGDSFALVGQNGAWICDACVSAALTVVIVKLTGFDVKDLWEYCYGRHSDGDLLEVIAAEITRAMEGDDVG